MPYLPENRELLPRKEVAAPASFAARMAFSSFRIRLPLM
jgi:hypothetical protein